jgi:hypothetical protein
MCKDETKPQDKLPDLSDVINKHDLTAKRNDWLVTPPAPVNSMLKGMIKEERDLPIAYLLLNVMCMTLPAACVVFYVGSNWLGFAYMIW